MQALFNWLVEPCIDYVRRNCKVSFAWPSDQLIFIVDISQNLMKWQIQCYIFVFHPLRGLNSSHAFDLNVCLFYGMQALLSLMVIMMNVLFLPGEGVY